MASYINGIRAYEFNNLRLTRFDNQNHFVMGITYTVCEKPLGKDLSKLSNENWPDCEKCLIWMSGFRSGYQMIIDHLNEFIKER